jgi:enamine deaminase RidA (YjgF/YER057c/UK114 family)
MPSDMSSPVFTLSNPAGLHDPTDNAYSHVAQVPLNARIVHLAGQGGQDREGYLAPGFAEQVRQTIANVEIGLAAAGATLSDVYKLTILVVDHSESRLAEWAADRFFLGDRVTAAFSDAKFPALRSRVVLKKLNCQDLGFCGFRCIILFTK